MKKVKNLLKTKIQINIKKMKKDQVNKNNPHQEMQNKMKFNKIMYMLINQ